MKRSAARAPRGALFGLSLFGFGAHLLSAACAPSVESFEGRGSKGGATPGEESGIEIQRCNGEPVGFSPTDPNTLPKCECKTGGAARCVPKDAIPTALVSALESCENGASAGACIPDSLVASGGAAPKTCQSSLGEGRCMSICIPEIGKNAGALTRGNGDVCAEDERCTPCLDPLKNNEPTGVCEIGKPVDCKSAAPPPSDPGSPKIACPYTGPPLIDVATLKACGDGAHCIPAAAAGPAAAMLAKCEGEAGSVCAPDKSIQAGGQYLPKSCNAVANAEGRCINAIIPAIAAQKQNLTKDTCDANELCAPCFDPTNGKETGVCRTVGCDAPKKPATTFKACCTEEGGEARAKCVPNTVIPAAQQEQLGDDDGTCVADQELCVPNEMLQPNYKGGVACQADMIFLGDYEGVCLSDCLEGVGILPRSTCEEGFKCVPCERGGEPTGAPGCKNNPPPPP